MSDTDVQRLTADDAPCLLPGLVDLLRDAVHDGASIGFLCPLADAEAEGYWRGVFREVASGSRILLAMRGADGSVAGTVQLGLCTRANGTHRAEVQKLIVHTRFRGRGLARLLMAEAERAAVAEGRSLLYLDTEPGKPAELLYRKLGWTCAGEIPDYASSPDGHFHGTVFYYKRI